jgi:hypothetical protein
MALRRDHLAGLDAPPQRPPRSTVIEGAEAVSAQAGYLRAST